ncbi:MAG: large subunit ribosomal protein L7/L12 [Planctomycetota bacterium]|jgi:large subunit ribosomal protein L7/L12
MSEETTKDAVDAAIEEVVETPAEAVEAVTEEAAPVAVEAKEEAPAEEVAPVAVEAEGEEVEVPAEFKAIVEAVEKMTVLELNKLVKVFEKKFGVSAAAVAVAGPAADAAEEQSEFSVVLVGDGGAKIPTMKVVKELLGLGLKEAKELVEGVPSVIKEGVKKEEAEEIKAKLEEAGAKVELK